jgi:hypothetical protein
MEPEVARAIEGAEGEPELKRWIEEQQELQAVLRRKFRELPVPAELRGRILRLACEDERRLEGAGAWIGTRHESIKEYQVWRRVGVWMAMAAAVLILAGVSVVWMAGRTDEPRLADFQTRMVRTVLREYRMDILASDMEEVRGHLRGRGAPADFELPRGLEAVSLMGGGRLTWQNEPVSMICFDRGGGDLLFLFVIGRQAVRDPPRESPELMPVNRLLTASWSLGDRIYVLAGELTEVELRDHL